MSQRIASLTFTNRKNCFIGLPNAWIKPSMKDTLLSFELSWDGGRIYVTWQGHVSSLSSSREAVEISSMFAMKHQLRDGQEVLVKELGPVQPCGHVAVEPLSVDDWEILELHSEFITGHLLDQVRLVWCGQILPIWVQKNICIFTKIGDMDPSAPCTLLSQNTEVIVSPKVRGHQSHGSLPPKMPATAHTQGHSASTHQSQTADVLPSQLDGALSTSDCMNGEVKQQDVDQTQDNSITTKDSSSTKDSGTPVSQALATNETGLFSQVFNAMWSWWAGDSAIEDSDSNHGLSDKYKTEIMNNSWDSLLRIQPFGILLDCHQERTESNHKVTSAVNVGHQPANVYISLRTFVDHFEVSCDTYPDVPCSFLATLRKVLSPDESEEAVKNAAAAQAKLKHRLQQKKDKEAILDDVNIGEATIHVRVIVLDENRTYRLCDSRGETISEVKFGDAFGASNSHVIIHDLLRRQLGLDITGKVRVQTTRKDNQVTLKKLTLHPLFKLPEDLTADMIITAFKMWLENMTTTQLPLVVSQGTLVKIFLKPGLFGEFLLSFESKATKSDDVSMEYCLLTRAACEEVKVHVAKQLISGKVSPPIQRLPNWSLEEIDPKVPAVLAAQLGGVDVQLDQLLRHLVPPLTTTPLGSHLFSSTPALQSGSVLVCGPRGTGKSMLSRGVCRILAEMPHLVHVHVVDCKSLKGKRVETIHQMFRKLFNELSWRQPAVLLLDDLDHIAAAPSGPEQEMSGEAQYYGRVAEVLKSVLLSEIREHTRVVMIGTCQSRGALHSTLVASRGHHLFQHTVELSSPNQVQREALLAAILSSKPAVACSTMSSPDLHKVASKTEGFVARDLDLVVDRAIHAHCLRNKADGQSSEVCLNDDDFSVALEGFTPAALRGVDLHKAGDISWHSIGGLHQVKQTLMETFQWPSKYPELFRCCPLRLRSGILLYGAPGTGKTLLAGAVAKECGLNFISIKGPELLSKYIGQSEQEVRNTFMRAQSAQPCILFFDEFDSLAPRRGHDSTGVTDRVVNQLLTQLDGVEGLQGVYVLAATSRPDLIDPALLRPGRLDQAIHCPLPDEDDREAILRALTASMNTGDDLDQRKLAVQCEHFTGADLKALLYNAQLEAIHQLTDFLKVGKNVRKVSESTTVSTDSYDMANISEESIEEVRVQGDDVSLTQKQSHSRSKVREHRHLSGDNEKDSSEGDSEKDQFDVLSSTDCKKLPLDGVAAGNVAFGDSIKMSDLMMTSHDTVPSLPSSVQNQHHSKEAAAVVIEKPKLKPPMCTAYVGNIEDGISESSAEYPLTYNTQARRSQDDGRDRNVSGGSGQDSSMQKAPTIHMKYLLKAASSMSPSVSASERRRYQAIYENFIGSRSGNFNMDAVGQKATLA